MYYSLINTCAVNFGPSGFGGGGGEGSVETVLQVGYNGWFTAKFHPGSCGMHCQQIAAVVEQHRTGVHYTSIWILSMLNAVEFEGKNACI